MEKKIQTNINLTEDLWEQAKIRATMERISLSELTRRALKEYLTKKEPKKKEGKK
jgi:hypothetical protein